MIESSALLADLKTQLRVLQNDLKERAGDSTAPWGAALQAEHAEALRRERTGLSWSTWRDNEVDQAAVAWIVATTFVRFCEDNDLLAGATLNGLPIPTGWIAGPGKRAGRARENQTAYFRVNTSHHDRDWLQHAFRVLAAQPAGAALIDTAHNPVWTAEISAEAAKGLVSFWRRENDADSLVHDFTDNTLDTRFLGDLYQDLSEHAKKTYALLQTPVFVEQFILDRTLTPAIAEFGVDGLKLIDPTCGSGHFLLGAFERINQQWAADAPAVDPKQRVRKAMDSIHGVDLNPFAVAIARFRLTVAALVAAGERSLVGVTEVGFHLAIGDSLLGEQGASDDLFDEETYTFLTEDVGEYTDILKPGRYHVVVGNPPYITVKDKVLSQKYRKAYSTAAGKYALSVPFMELFFRLAIKGEPGQGAGHVGQITSNSFMKREFGKKLIEDLFAGHHNDNPVDLISVIDTSGAYIPGHGTPTVIVIGRRRRPVSRTIRAVLGVRGEPGRPTDAASGLVWAEIIENIDIPGLDGTYVTVTDLAREILTKFPWSLSGGGASELFEVINEAKVKTLESVSSSLGIISFTLEDDVFVLPTNAIARRGIEDYSRPMVLGDQLRDWAWTKESIAIFPYSEEFEPIDVAQGTVLHYALWPFKTNLSNSKMFGGKNKVEAGLKWTEFGRLTSSKLKTPLTITFAFVATHNHFVLDRGGKVFNRSAPVIKLPESATEEQHLELLGVLNSSVACFWLKQVSHNKGSTVDTKGARQTLAPWEDFYEFTGTKLQEFPLPRVLPRVRSQRLENLAQKLTAAVPHAAITKWGAGDNHLNLAELITLAERQWNETRQRMFFEQEELDWETYLLYGLTDVDLTHSEDLQISLGERAFEIALARRLETVDEESAWFERHKSAPSMDLPAEWPERYREVVTKRLDLIAADRSISLLESPECKRRWASVPWDKQLKDALEAAILDRFEDSSLWSDAQGPTPRSAAQLADLLRNDEALLELARVLTGNPEPELAAVIGSLALTEAVPYLAAYRYKEPGLEKFREWQAVWDLQRREDAGEDVTIPVPPKYTTPNFQKVEYWKARGKLDVPKERFVLYPGIGREGDTSVVLGWTGWNHRDQAVALVRELMNQQAVGATDEALVPMIAGLVELEPWLHQWHTELEPNFGSSAAQAVTSQIDQLLAQLRLTRDNVNAWRPPAASRARRRRV